MDTEEERTTTLPSQLDVKPDKDAASIVPENNGSLTANPVGQTNDQSYTPDKDLPILGSSSTEKTVDSMDKRDADHTEFGVAQKVPEPGDPTPAPEVGLVTENAADVGAEHPPPLPMKEIEEVDRDNSTGVEDPLLEIDQQRSQSESTDVRGDSEGQLKDVEEKIESSADKKQSESSVDKKQQGDQKRDSPMKLEDQLDEVSWLYDQ